MYGGIKRIQKILYMLGYVRYFDIFDHLLPTKTSKGNTFAVALAASIRRLRHGRYAKGAHIWTPVEGLSQLRYKKEHRFRGADLEMLRYA